MSGSRPRHPDKHLEALLSALESDGWRVVKGRKYFKIYCPCPDEHLKTVHISPSNPNYQRNFESWLRRMCWKGGAP